MEIIGFPPILRVRAAPSIMLLKRRLNKQEYSPLTSWEGFFAAPGMLIAGGGATGKPVRLLRLIG